MARNLVVVRAGHGSLHPYWQHSESEDSFHLIVSYYEEPADDLGASEEDKVFFQGGKWEGIHALFQQRPELLIDYDFFWFPDDDISLIPGDIDKLFAIAANESFDVCQPSLTHDSHYSHVVYLQCQQFRLRYSDSVEIMVPCLSRRALRQVLPLFALTRTGFGMDGLWTRAMHDNRWKAAIIDEVAVRHCRPVGGQLHRNLREAGQLSGNQERERLYQSIGTNLDGVLVYEGVLRSGRFVKRRIPLLRLMLQNLRRNRSQIVHPIHWSHELRRLAIRQLFKRLRLQKLGLPTTKSWETSRSELSDVRAENA